MRLVELCNAPKNDLIQCCACVFEESSPKFNFIFALSTYLDPFTRKYLNFVTTDFNLHCFKGLVNLKLKPLCPANAEPAESAHLYKELDSMIEIEREIDKIRM